MWATSCEILVASAKCLVALAQFPTLPKKRGGEGGMMVAIGVQDIINTDLVSDSDCWKYHFRGTQFYFLFRAECPWTPYRKPPLAVRISNTFL